LEIDGTISGQIVGTETCNSCVILPVNILRHNDVIVNAFNIS